jgi:hypothetical protein
VAHAAKEHLGNIAPRMSRKAALRLWMESKRLEGTELHRESSRIQVTGKSSLGQTQSQASAPASDCVIG